MLIDLLESFGMYLLDVLRAWPYLALGVRRR